MSNLSDNIILNMLESVGLVRLWWIEQKGKRHQSINCWLVFESKNHVVHCITYIIDVFTVLQLFFAPLFRQRIRKLFLRTQVFNDVFLRFLPLFC